MRAATIILSGLSALVAAQTTTSAADIGDVIESGVSSVLSAVSSVVSNGAGTPEVRYPHRAVLARRPTISYDSRLFRCTKYF